MAVEGIFKNDRAKTIYPQELPNRLSTNTFSVFSQERKHFMNRFWKFFCCVVLYMSKIHLKYIAYIL